MPASAASLSACNRSSQRNSAAAGARTPRRWSLARWRCCAPPASTTSISISSRASPARPKPPGGNLSTGWSACSRSSSGQPRLFCGRRCASAPACSRSIRSPQPLSPVFILILRNDSTALLPFAVLESISNQLIQTHDYALHALNSQLETGNRGNFFRRHPLPVVKPENLAISLADGRLLQQVVDIAKQQPPFRSVLPSHIMRQRGLLRMLA